MQVDIDRLRGKIVERRMTHEELASKIGVDTSTLSRKLKCNGLTFTVGQMHKIADALNLSHNEARQIFLR